MIKPIEQTAIECGGIFGTSQSWNTQTLKYDSKEFIKITPAQLQSFFDARCAELSEPVGEISQVTEDGWELAKFAHPSTFSPAGRQPMPVGSKLYLAPPKQPLAVPSGFKIVPIEPDAMMIINAVNSQIKTNFSNEESVRQRKLYESKYRQIYSAMVFSAPTPPESE